MEQRWSVWGEGVAETSLTSLTESRLRGLKYDNETASDSCPSSGVLGFTDKYHGMFLKTNYGFISTPEILFEERNILLIIGLRTKNNHYMVMFVLLRRPTENQY